MKNKDQNKEERILNSLEGMQKVNAPDFFYTRLLGRMQKEQDRESKPFFLLRPAFITAALAIALVFNLVSLTGFNKKQYKADTVKSNAPTTIESFAKAYNLQSESVYE